MAELIVALDFDDTLDALQMATQLRKEVNWVKVGLELFITEGPRIVQTLHGMGFKVFLDLKLHDIPATVLGATRAAITSGADLLSLHIVGGQRMCEAAVQATQEAQREVMLFGVTVLTSLGEKELPGYTGDLGILAQHLAQAANAWGLTGVVCSGHEVERIKSKNPGLMCLTPGIRLATGNSDDQRRIMTPAQAVSNGSDFLVVGRPITRAADPVQAALDVLEDMEKAG